MYDKHLSSQFDSELNSVSSNVLELGGLVEMQIRQAIYALSEFSVEVADQVEKEEARVNALELEIDRALSNIIARRQPTAIDLRLLLAISKTTANLERVGDEAAKIARMVKRIIDSGKARVLPTAATVSSRAKASSALRSRPDAMSAATRRSDEGSPRAVPLPMMDFTMRAILLASSPTRSRLAVVLEMAINRRRSRAVGWRRPMIEDNSRSISTSMAFTRCSVSMTWSAASVLNWVSA